MLNEYFSENTNPHEFDINDEYQKWVLNKDTQKIIRGYRDIYGIKNEFIPFENGEINHIHLSVTGSGFSSWGLYRSIDNIIYLYYYGIISIQSNGVIEKSPLRFIEISLESLKKEIKLTELIS